MTCRSRLLVLALAAWPCALAAQDMPSGGLPHGFGGGPSLNGLGLKGEYDGWRQSPSEGVLRDPGHRHSEHLDPRRFDDLYHHLDPRTNEILRNYKRRVPQTIVTQKTETIGIDRGDVTVDGGASDHLLADKRRATEDFIERLAQTLPAEEREALQDLTIQATPHQAASMATLGKTVVEATPMADRGGSDAGMFESLVTLQAAGHDIFSGREDELLRGWEAADAYAARLGLDAKTVDVMDPATRDRFISEGYRARVLRDLGLNPSLTGAVLVNSWTVDGRPIISVPVSLDEEDIAVLRSNDEERIRDWQRRQDWLKNVGPKTEIGGVSTETVLPNDSLAMISASGQVRTDTPVRDDSNPLGQEVVGVLSTSSERGVVPDDGTLRCGPAAERNCFDPAVSLHTKGIVQCSGVLVAPQWVLTAAHCVCTGAPSTASLGQVTPNRHGVGVFSRARIGGTGPLQAPVASAPISATRHFFRETPDSDVRNDFCLRYRDFVARPVPASEPVELAALRIEVPDPLTDWRRVRDQTYGARDLVLLHLRRPLSLVGMVLPAAIGDHALLEAESALFVAGFGRNDWEPRGGHKTILGMGVRWVRCVRPSPENGCQPGKEMILSDTEGRSDSCYGDSGAGVYKVLPNGRVAVVALVSRGIRRGPCGPGGINVLLTESAVRAWITAVAKDAVLHVSNQ